MEDDFDPVTYADVNGAWQSAKLPPITVAEGSKRFRQLVRKFGGKKMTMPLWFGRRSWASTQPLDMASTPYRWSGLPNVVHDAGHWVHRRLHRNKLKTHCAPHAALEKAMIEHVIAKGWHLPTAKPAPKAKPTKAERIAHAEKLLKKWMTKKRRAETAIRKLNAKARRLAREEARASI